MSRRALRLLWCSMLGLAALATPPAMAWGPQGHALVADIASAHLAPETRTAVTRLLAIENRQRLDEIAAWPDAIRSDRPETGAWHYVDIPRAATHYDKRRDCPAGRCVVTQIAHFAAILGDRHQPSTDRLVALKFLVHFVGDVHQPLHAADDNDKGGNTVQLTYFGRRTNLHRIWDSAIVDRALGLHVGPQFQIALPATRTAARTLDDMITAAERNRWRAGIDARHIERAAVRWANQSHRLARTTAYGKLPAAPRRDWSAGYQRQAWPVARRQLQRAGIRLADVLNAELAP
ncbi:S1/P1 nuclease [Salinisphaera sp. Q1T1-3]|uniref:S1/P1 nuclease n=1 Tax=Salinisphaera sp. Q1T1-3 TaxID=2321229 RepID=UPI0011C387B3|nr:S1/P1 nuclease [Salinisphaera sp. Q1T1-3]